MVKKFLALLLAFSILSQNLVNVAIGVYYHVNKEYISKQLCENRNNPQIHCNGHCYLSRQLQNAEKGEKQSAQLIKEKEELAVNPFENSLVQFIPAYTVISLPDNADDLYVSYSPQGLIKPPAAV